MTGVVWRVAVAVLLTLGALGAAFTVGVVTALHLFEWLGTR